MLAVSWKRHEIADFGEIAQRRRGMLEPVTTHLDFFLRSIGLAFSLVLMLVVAARGGWRPRADLLAVVACVGAYLVCATPSQPCCSSPAFLPLLLGAIGFPFAFWRLARVVLQDERGIPVPAWIGLAGLLVSGVFAATDYLGFAVAERMAFGGVNKAIAFVFVVGALLTAWRSWDGDLVEPRRKLRWVLVGYLGAYGLIILVGEVYLLGQPAPPWLDVLNVLMIDLTLLATLLFLVGVRPDAMQTLFDPAAPPEREPPQQPSESVPSSDEPILARLRRLMDEEKLYRDHELSVSRLATQLTVPEYILRRLIHDRLGYRNFAAFVNEYRLREVSQQLADPALDRRPILTLALEAGFGSIGPFNRIFRERHGITPTEFRTRKPSK
ncbi:MAG: helix-turn-helix domain-containing protein [Burkholderiaceae bacterium]